MPTDKKAKTTFAEPKTSSPFSDFAGIKDPSSLGALSTDRVGTGPAPAPKAASRNKTRAKIQGASVSDEVATTASGHMRNILDKLADVPDDGVTFSDDDIADYFSDFDLEHDDDSDVKAPTRSPEPKTKNALTTINKTVWDPNKPIDREVMPFEPEFHAVKDLPGYFVKQIRALGRMVFAPFTDTPIENLAVMATLVDDESDVKKMMKWIQMNGIRDDRAELKFDELLPDYEADVQIWNVDKTSFMLVKDFAGYYIYGWPGGRGVHVGTAPEHKRLGKN